MKNIILTFIFSISLINTFSQGLVLVPENEYKKIKSPPIQSGAGTLRDRFVIPNSSFPPPRSQGKQPSCTGWAVGFGFMSFYQAAKNNWTFNSDDYIFSPSYIYQSIKECDDCSCGSRIDYALDFLKNYGNVPLTYFPYKQNSCSKPSTNLQNVAKEYKISDWFRIEDIKNLTEIKRYLSNNMPIIVSVKVDKAFENFYYKSDNDTYEWSNSSDYDFHAMLVVGYDDNRNAMRLLNSWGTSWGTDGYGWVDYKSFRAMIDQAFVVEKDYNKREMPKPINSTTISENSFEPYAFKEQIREGRNYYTFGFKIDETVRPLVKKIVYVYDHPSFYNKYSTSTNAPNFTNSYEGWGCLSNMQAIVNFKDGSTLTINFDACRLLNNSSHTNVELTSTNINPVVTAEPTNQKGRYYFRIQLRGIENIKESIVKVVYDRNHPSFDQRYVTTFDKDNNFQGGYEGWGCLQNLGITIYFNNNTKKTFYIDMCKKLGWE